MTHASPPGAADLVRALAEAGLIQFGRFQRPDGTAWPVAVRLTMLPSYPATLRQVVAALVPLLDGVAADRVLTTTDAIPLGVALALASGVPVTYPTGQVRDYTAAFAIEGAYDVGHPTALLADVLLDATQAEAITTLARRVGLDVRAVLTVLDLGIGARTALEAAGYTVRCALTLREALPVLETGGWLPVVMRVSVERWIEGYGL